MELFRIQIGHLIYKRVCSVASWENKLVCFLSSSGMKRVWKRPVADSFFLCAVGLFYFLGSIVNFSQEADVHFKYIQVQINDEGSDSTVKNLLLLTHLVIRPWNLIFQVFTWKTTSKVCTKERVAHAIWLFCPHSTKNAIDLYVFHFLNSLISGEEFKNNYFIIFWLMLSLLPSFFFPKIYLSSNSSAVCYLEYSFCGHVK